MNAVLAIIANGERASIVINRETVLINYFLLINPVDDGLFQPLANRLRGVRYVRPSKPYRWRGKRLHHGGDVYVLVFI